MICRRRSPPDSTIHGTLDLIDVRQQHPFGMNVEDAPA